MMPYDTFVELMHGLGDDLVDADGRRDAVYRRIRRVRRRRTALAAAVAVMVVAAGIGIAAGRTPPVHTPAQAVMPVSWVAEDGVTYRRIAVETLDTGTPGSITVTMPASAPVALLATCDPSGEPIPSGATATELPELSVRLGHESSGTHTILCGTSKLTDYDVSSAAAPAGTVTVTVTGYALGYAGLFKVFPARWTIGFYVWQTPATLRPAPVLPAMPQQRNGFTLAASDTGVWPARTASFHVPAGVVWGVMVTCSGAFAGTEVEGYQGWSLTVDGQPGFSSTCNGIETVPPGWTPAGYPPDGSKTTRPIMVTVTFNYDSMYNMRSGSWLVGMYYRAAS